MHSLHAVIMVPDHCTTMSMIAIAIVHDHDVNMLSIAAALQPGLSSGQCVGITARHNAHGVRGGLVKTDIDTGALFGL